MRVVAGTARGRRLSAPAGSDTRPTPDRVRQATFNALDSRGAVVGAAVLDAFAGSGALGIEALSRGAGRATFVERDRSARQVITANLAGAGVEDRSRLVGGDAYAHLVTTDERYDLVLLDPPHATDTWPDLLALVAARLHDDGLVVVESDRPVVDADGAVEGAGRDGAGRGPTRWTVVREKRYSGTVVQMLSSDDVSLPDGGSPS